MSMTDDQEKAEILAIAVDEQRRVYDKLSDHYDQTKVKNLTFIGASLALLTYLYSGGDLFIPTELYGRIFYFLGLAAVIIPLGLLMYNLRPAFWMFPTEYKDLRNIKEKTKLGYLEYIKNQYMECWVNNIAIYEQKTALLNKSFIPLIVGAIILVVIKTF